MIVPCEAIIFAKTLGMPEDPAEISKVHPRVLAMSTEAEFVAAIAEMPGGFFAKNLAKSVYALAKKALRFLWKGGFASLRPTGSPSLR